MRCCCLFSTKTPKAFVNEHSAGFFVCARRCFTRIVPRLADCSFRRVAACLPDFRDLAFCCLEYKHSFIKSGSLAFFAVVLESLWVIAIFVWQFPQRSIYSPPQVNGRVIAWARSLIYFAILPGHPTSRIRGGCKINSRLVRRFLIDGISGQGSHLSRLQ
jgi:hypothetical protein